MARMYSRNRGKSGSHKPKHRVAPWAKHKPKEITEIVTKFAKEGKSSSEIGLILRDQYGIPSVRMSDLRVTKIMKEADTYPSLPEDMFNLVKKAADLKTHLDKNKKDYTSKRGLELTESKIRRLAKYYKRNKLLPKDWKWNIQQAKLLIK